jgi:hypothetical protein
VDRRNDNVAVHASRCAFAHPAAVPPATNDSAALTVVGAIGGRKK